MKSRILKTISVGAMSLVLAMGVMTRPAMAACNNMVEVAGIRAWFYNLEMDDDCSPTGTPEEITGQVIQNIAYDLMTVGSVVAFGMMLYAGYLMVLSGGDATKYAKGKKTLVGAIIGLVITILAKAIIVFVSKTLML